jgi:putative ABC transport system substrate-binding protein
MRRWHFITLIGSAATWPLAVRAQQASKLPRTGFLGLTSPSAFGSRLEAFRQGLRDFGYVEGTSISIEYRWAEGHYGRLPELAAEIVRANEDLIVTHATPGSLAAKQVTTTIPIVVALIGDPITSDIVASLARPGGNITGQSFFNGEVSLATKACCPSATAKKIRPRNRTTALMSRAQSPQMARAGVDYSSCRRRSP